MNIRIMTIEDYEAIFRLWQGTSGMGLRSLDDAPDGIQKFLERNPRSCFVAEDECGIQGVIMSGHDGRRGFIYHTTVRENSRGQGLGAALVRAAETALKAEGINKVALVAYQNNEQGNRFWEKQGYTTRDDLVYRNKSLNSANEV
jgi:ribosomal protein S18 acetylase RimI-like enzyme